MKRTLSRILWSFTLASSIAIAGCGKQHADQAEAISVDKSVASSSDTSRARIIRGCLRRRRLAPPSMAGGGTARPQARPPRRRCR